MSNRVESPLVNIDFSHINISPSILKIQEPPLLTHINLRGRADNADFLSAVESVSGMTLPLSANTFNQKDARTLIWLAPDEWLLLAEPDTSGALCSAFNSAFSNTFASASDVSGAHAMLVIQGQCANDLLAKGTPFDVHESVFKTGESAQTVIGHAGATILKIDHAPIYQLIFRRSFADYLGAWIVDAAKEFAQ